MPDQPGISFEFITQQLGVLYLERALALEQVNALQQELAARPESSDKPE